MINFFAILLIIFIGILLLVLKKRSFKKLINKSNLYSIKSNKNNKFSPNKNRITFSIYTTKPQLEHICKYFGDKVTYNP